MLKQDVAAALQALDPVQATAEQVNNTLMTACAKVFPPQASSSEPRPWQTQQVQICVKNMWQAYHSMQRVQQSYPEQIIPLRSRPIVVQYSSSDIQNGEQRLEAACHIAVAWQDSQSMLLRSFHALRLFAQLHKQQKILRQRGQEKRTAKITAVLEAAQSAAAAGDMHKLYKEVRKPSPKNPEEKIQIRGPENQILSQASEHAEIVKHFSSVFTRHAPAEATPWLALHLQISDAEVQHSLRKQPSGKAVPPWLIPPEVWKLCSADLMPHIQGMIKRYFAPGELFLPDSWTDSWLCLLPKPNKPAKISKIYAPLHYNAPLANASISRASAHCAESRAMLKAQRIEIQDKRQGRTSPTAAGSAVFSLDMNMAFDLVSQDYLIAALKFARVEEDLINVVLALQRSKYLVSHQGHEGNTEWHTPRMHSVSVVMGLCDQLHVTSTQQYNGNAVDPRRGYSLCRRFSYHLQCAKQAGCRPNAEAHSWAAAGSLASRYAGQPRKVKHFTSLYRQPTQEMAEK